MYAGEILADVWLNELAKFIKLPFVKAPNGVITGVCPCSSLTPLLQYNYLSAVVGVASIVIRRKQADGGWNTTYLVSTTKDDVFVFYASLSGLG